MGGKLYHMGFSSGVACSTLADADESRPHCAHDPMAVDLYQSLYALVRAASTYP